LTRISNCDYFLSTQTNCEIYFFSTQEDARAFTEGLNNWKILWSINKKKWLTIKINQIKDK
jgi:hypothetical protein